MQCWGSLVRAVIRWKILAFPVAVSISTLTTLELFPFSFWWKSDGRGETRTCLVARTITSLAPQSIRVRRRSPGAVGIFKAPIGRMSRPLVDVTPKSLRVKSFRVPFSAALAFLWWCPLSLMGLSENSWWVGPISPLLGPSKLVSSIVTLGKIFPFALAPLAFEV